MKSFLSLLSIVILSVTLGCDNEDDVVAQTETMGVQVKVELKVGEIPYLNVDSKIKVTAYDKANGEKWKEEFSYTGPEANTLLLKTGIHHYNIEVSQWGIIDKQTFLGSYLWENRAEGSKPITYILGGSIPAKKISHYINYLQRTIEGTTISDPQYKVSYEYNSEDKVSKILFHGFSQQSNDFYIQRYFNVIYSNNRVEKLVGFHPDESEAYIEDLYFYNEAGQVSKIVEDVSGSGIDKEVTLTYNLIEKIINASYAYSNGTSFQYEFVDNAGNLATDKTTRGGQLCSTGAYQYDKNINPLKQLGYVDFLLQNYSINNKIDEDMNEVACAFSELIPDKFEHEYNPEGYPTVSTTFYRSETFLKGQTFYYYY
jgi:hypothetical protein